MTTPEVEGSNAGIPEKSGCPGAPVVGEKFDPGSAILHHIADAHSFHFFDIKKSDGSTFSASIPLPVILYSPQKGLDVFMSSKFHHGETEYKGYRLDHEKVVPVEPGVKVYDFSMTKNVVQMIFAVLLLIWLLTSIVKKYKYLGLPLDQALTLKHLVLLIKARIK